MFFQLAKFEFNYFRKQPSFIVTMLVFFLFAFFAMVSDNIQIGASASVNFNSPHAITQTMLIMSLIGMFLVANFVGGTAVRDYSHKMDGIMLSMPVAQGSYIWGRLFGSYLFCLTVFAMVPLGTLLGSFWPGVDSERLGETMLAPYFWSYLVFVIPNFLFCSVLFYIFAVKTRTMMGMYLGVVGFFIFYNISQSLLDNPDYSSIGALADPFALGAFMETTRYWTPFERNSLMVDFNDDILLNRILWLSITAFMMFIAHIAFDLRKPVKVKSKKLKKDDQKPPSKLVIVKPDFSQSIEGARFWARTKFEVLQIVKSAPFIILCLISMFSLVSIFFDVSGAFGTPNWPLTRDMAMFIEGAFAVMVIIVLVYYSAEIVWRERNLGIGEIVESTSIKNPSIYFPKIIALTSVIVSLALCGVAFATIYQVFKGFSNIEWSVYFGLLSLSFVIPMAILAILAVFIQILSPNKYIGMLIFVAYFILSIVARNLGMEHHMWRIGSTPALVYSDINTYGHFLEAVLWYNLYWLAFTTVLIVTGYGMWARGAEYSIKYRFSMLTKNMGVTGTAVLTLALVSFLGSGSYIYYNTRVVNDFYSDDEVLDARAEFEGKYRQFEDDLIPTITDVYAEVDFYPQHRKVVTKGHYLIENQNEKPLSRVLIGWDSAKHRTLSFTVAGATEVDRDDRFGQTWIEFEPALEPKQKSRLDFEFVRENKGFKDQDTDTRVVENGSFVNNAEIFPHFGYKKSFELSDRHERRKRNLPPPERVAKLEDLSKYGETFTGKEADYINFETIVSTSADQFAISPGYLEKEWEKNGRNYYHYKMDAPILNFVSFLSGRFASKKDLHNEVAIEVYHHAQHGMNIDRMIEATKHSLDYFGEQFGPYQHRQVRIIEFPRYAGFAQSFPNTIPYSEDIGYVADLRDVENIDYVYFVTAHELAHQWWGHQIAGANVQGGAVLSETLAEYSAYMQMEKYLGKRHLRKFLKWEMDRYLQRRTREAIEEMPLYRAENQQYIHYQKGGVVMYSIRDRIGAEPLNLALKKLLEKFKYQSDPFPTTLDLIEHIKAEAPVEEHAFIDDLFTKITLFDLEMKSATATKLDNGRYQLSLIVDAKKVYADGQGEETEAPLEQTFDIGIFAVSPDDKDATDEDILYLDKHLIKSGENTITLEVSKLPKYAGIDPYITMIGRDSDDNLKTVELKSD
jgi:ABC-2 type transport system permease protein